MKPGFSKISEMLPGVRSARLAARPGLVIFLGYLSAVVVTVSILVYLTFPWDKLSVWIEGKMEDRLGVEISVGESAIHFPFHLVWKKVTLSGMGGTSPLEVSADHFSVKWPLQAILARRLEIEFSTRIFGGEFRGRLVSQKVPNGVRYHLTGNGEGFDIGVLAAMFKAPVEDLKGSIRVNHLEHEWINQNWRLGKGIVVVEAFNVDTAKYGLVLSEVKGRVVLKSGMASLEDISARGKSIELVGSGSVLLRPNFPDSLLDFNSRLTLKNPTGLLAILSTMASPGGGLDLAFRGPLRRPVLYINGQPLPSVGLGLMGLGIKKSPGEKIATGHPFYEKVLEGLSG